MDLKLEVYDKNLDLLDALSGIESIVWRDDAFSAGHFSLVAFLTDETAELLKAENFIWITDTSLGLIESVDTAAEDNGVTRITAEGRMAAALFDRRVLWGTYNLTGTPAEIMCYIVNECCVSPTRGVTSARVFSFLDLDNTPTGGTSTRMQRTGTVLLEALEDIGETHQVAFAAAFQPTTARLLFTCYYGVDRSTEQSTVDPVLFSTELDDVISSNYSYSSEEYRNVALIGGQVDDETEVRSYAAIEDGFTGVDRRELFVDARDLSMTDGEETLTEEEYTATLASRGRSKLAEHACAESFEVDVLTQGSTYEYGVDFFLGDTITVSDERLGLSINAVVTAVTRGVTRNGETLSLTLGYSKPTIKRYIRKAVS